MRFLSAIVVIILLAFISGDVNATSCEQHSSNVVVKRLKKNVKYVRNYSIGNLTQLHTGRYQQGGPQVGGLGGGSVGVNVEVGFKVKSKNGLSCVSVDKVESKFIVFPTIMIASNYPKGSCEFDAVYEHEKKHIQTLMNFQQEYSVKLKRHLKKIVSKYRQSRASSPMQIEATKREISRDINRSVDSYFKKITPVLKRRQRAVDSPEEYKRVADLCTGWSSAAAPKIQRKY